MAGRVSRAKTNSTVVRRAEGERTKVSVRCVKAPWGDPGESKGLLTEERSRGGEASINREHLGKL